MRNKAKILLWTGVVVLACCFLFCVIGCKKQMDKAKRHYERGIEYHKQELVDQAIEELKQAVKIDPNYVEAHYELGILYDEKGDREAAFREFKQTVEINPDHADAHYRLGLIYRSLRGYKQALAEFEEVLRINPNYPRIQTAIGDVYFERALRAWGAAIKLDWSYRFPDTLEEISYKNKDELKKAIDDYVSIIESDSTNVAVLSELSLAYLEWAQDEYLKAVTVDSLDTAAQLQLGLTYSYKGYQNKAMKQYEILKNIEPRAAGMLLQEIQKEEQGAEELKKRGMKK